MITIGWETNMKDLIFGVLLGPGNNYIQNVVRID